jgi:DNA-binding GntR family transcriptional regulator
VEDLKPMRLAVREDQMTLSLPEQIAAKLGDQIIGGAFEPGAHLIEQKIALEFGISRGPVRDAFRILEHEGLVTFHPRRGVTVTRLTEADMREIFEINTALMPLTGRRLASVRSVEAVRLMDEAIRKAKAHVASDDGADAFAAIGQHLTVNLARVAGNGRLARIVAIQSLESYRYRRLAFESQTHRRRTLVRWRALKVAIKKGDVAGAEAAFAHMIHNVQAEVENKLSLG